MLLSFRQFLETTERKPTFLGGLEDELGIPPEAFNKVPQISSFFKLGDMYNLNNYEILGYNYNTDDESDMNRKPVSVRIRLLSDPKSPTLRRYGEKDGKYIRKEANPADDKIYVIPIQQLQSMMLQGSQQQQQPMGMGGM